MAAVRDAALAAPPIYPAAPKQQKVRPTIAGAASASEGAAAATGGTPANGKKRVKRAPAPGALSQNEQVADEIDAVIAMAGLRPTYLDRASYATAVRI